MLETSTIWRGGLGLLVASCASPQPVVEAPAPPAPAVVVAPAPTPPAAPTVDARAEEARALLAQAETDVQRARARRALWQRAWEDLIAARQAVAAKDHATAVRHSRNASELAKLGLEQLAYPAVK